MQPVTFSITDSPHYPKLPLQHPRLVVVNDVARSVAPNLTKNHGQSHLIWHLTPPLKAITDSRGRVMASMDSVDVDLVDYMD